MSEYLVFTLEARMGSFGGLAGHERRGSANWPGKSALIGMLGAAMGVDRDDKDQQDLLRALSFAVAVHDPGEPLRDFHTTQTIAQKIKSPRSRAEALLRAEQGNALKTSISYRDYRCGVLYTVAVWGGKIDLKRIKSALSTPVYTLYLGRKSCPLSAPVAATVVSAESPVEALRNTVLPPWRQSGDKAEDQRWQYIAADDHPAMNSGIAEWRHDDPVDRGYWHFQAREVFITPGTQG